MKTAPWTRDEVALLADGSIGNAQISVMLKRSEAAVRGKRQRLGLSSPKDALTYAEDKTRQANDYWRGQFKALSKKYAQALKETSATKQLVDLATTLAPKSYAAPKLEVRSRKADGSAQSAVLLLSDCHVGQVVEASQTLGYGGYNFPTFLARLKFLEDGVISIIQDHTTTDIDELVVCLGGDLIDGALDHGAEVGQHSTLFEQVYGAGHALAQFLRNLSAVVPKIRVYNTTGNHPRLPNQKRTPTDGRFSNFDLFLASYVEALVKDILSIEWSLDKQPSTIFDVQGFKFLLAHGDNLRGGDRALGIPNHAVGRAISSTNQLFGKNCEPSPNYYLVGHLHRSIVLPHARGSFIVNGGFVGTDSYGLAGGFSPVDPSQTFFFVHPKFAKTATYDIQLKFAKVGKVCPYLLPQTFLPK